MTATAIAIIAALAAACLFGVSSVLMFRAAQTAPETEQLRLRLLARLGRSPLWLAGAALQAVSFAVQGLALAFGPLTLVQPLAATDLLFALPFLAYSSRRRMRRAEWTGAALVACGVGLFVGLSPPVTGVKVPSLADWLSAAVLVGVAIGVAAGAALHTAGVVRTTLLAVAAGAAFALLDAVSKASVGVLREHGVVALALSWHPYALAGIGVFGLLASQTAFQSGSLQASLPVIDTLEPTLAVLLGALVFDEQLARSPGLFAAQITSGGVALAGIAVLDRSPVVLAHRQTGRSPSAPRTADRRVR